MLLCECDITELAGLMDQEVGKREFQLRQDNRGTVSIDTEMSAISAAHDALKTMTNDTIEVYQLEKLRGFLKSIDIPVLLLTDDLTSPHGQQALRSMTLLRRNIYFDVLPAFDRLPDLHLSARGHRQIAAAVYRDILRFGIETPPTQ